MNKVQKVEILKCIITQFFIKNYLDKTIYTYKYDLFMN